MLRARVWRPPEIASRVGSITEGDLSRCLSPRRTCGGSALRPVMSGVEDVSLDNEVVVFGSRP